MAAKDQTQVEDKSEQGGQISSRVDTRAHKHLLEERDLGALLVEVWNLLLAVNHLTREVEDKDLKRQAGAGQDIVEGPQHSHKLVTRVLASQDLEETKQVRTM